MKLSKTFVTITLCTLFSLGNTELAYANKPLSAKKLTQNFQQAVKAYQQGEYHTAFKQFKPLAEQGDAVSQYNLAQMYRNGQGVRQDYAQALNWYFKSAEQGYPDAQYALASMYESGQGVQQNYFESVKWYQKAAEQGYAMAQTNLGVMYALGQGVRVDLHLAKEWAGRGCDNGNQNGCDLYRILNERGN